jgi:hypothetical protein
VLTPVIGLRLWALGAGIERVIAVFLSIISNTSAEGFFHSLLTRIASGDSKWGSHSKKGKLLTMKIKI